MTRLEQLVNISTPAEIGVYDKLLGQRPEYTFHAGTYADGLLADSLDLSAEEGRRKFDERYLRKGLAWMMALAKVELGATVSMYGDERIEKPFSLLPPNRLDLEAFLTLVRDDLQAHLIALPGDPGFAEITRRNRKPDSWTLAYMRRMDLMTDMIGVLHSVGDSQLSARLRPAWQELSDYTRQLQKQIERADMPVVSNYAKFFDNSKTKSFGVQDMTCEMVDGVSYIGSPGSGTSGGK